MSCSQKHENLGDSKFCPECGMKIETANYIQYSNSENTISSISGEAPLPKSDARRHKIFETIKKYYLVGGLVIAIIALITIFQSPSNLDSEVAGSESNQTSDNNSGVTALDTSWVPAGFNVWTDNSDIAFRWSPSNSYSCQDYGCIQAQFISSSGCPNGLYAAINWLDAPAGESGSVISYDNATLPSLLPGQIAKLRFDDIEGNGKSAQMAEISCR